MLLNKTQQQPLLALAQASIAYGLEHGRAVPVNLDEYARELKVLRATFVTLEIKQQLRGCVGMLEPIRPLVVDIAENAVAAAFQDPRFPPLSTSEYPQLEIYLSILGPTELMQFDSEADLIAQLRPHIDGLIIQDGSYRGTFLPSVWASLTEPDAFLQHLKQKAGLPYDYWSNTLTVSRYQCQIIP